MFTPLVKLNEPTTSERPSKAKRWKAKQTIITNIGTVPSQTYTAYTNYLNYDTLGYHMLSNI